MQGRTGRSPRARGATFLIAILLVATAVMASMAALPAGAAAAPKCENRPQVNTLDTGRGILESVAVDPRGRLFYTDSDAGELLMLRRPTARPKLIVGGIDAPGGIVFRRDGKLLVGFGDSIAQALDGPLNPEAGLLLVDPKKKTARLHTEGLQMANGVARGPGRTIYASIDIGSGVDRIRKGEVQLNWSNVLSANGMVVDRAGENLFVNQTFTVAAIQRVPLDNPAGAAPYFTAGVADVAAGFDGLARDARDRLYVAANSGGGIWRVDGPGQACVLVEYPPFPSGPSDVAFGRRGSGFPAGNLYVTTFGGELLELVHARR